jgi:hypothetical protein
MSLFDTLANLEDDDNLEQCSRKDSYHRLPPAANSKRRAKAEIDAAPSVHYLVFPLVWPLEDIL